MELIIVLVKENGVNEAAFLIFPCQESSMAGEGQQLIVTDQVEQGNTRAYYFSSAAAICRFSSRLCTPHVIPTLAGRGVGVPLFGPYSSDHYPLDKRSLLSFPP